MNSSLSTVEIHPPSIHKYSVIWLHGLGADGHDFEAIVPELHLKQEPHIHFIFPNAPIQPVTINQGMKMRSWYDIQDLSVVRKVKTTDIHDSSKLIEGLIQQEINKGIPPSNIVLAGFSQGGVIALHTALEHSNLLGGIVALSTYLPTAEKLKNSLTTEKTTLPILLIHGTRDPVIPIDSAKQALNDLQAMGLNIDWHEYDMEHTVCMEEIDVISNFMNSLFTETGN